MALEALTRRIREQFSNRQVPIVHPEGNVVEAAPSATLPQASTPRKHEPLPSMPLLDRTVFDKLHPTLTYEQLIRVHRRKDVSYTPAAEDALTHPEQRLTETQRTILQTNVPGVILTEYGYIKIDKAHPNVIANLAQQGNKEALDQLRIIQEAHAGRHNAVGPSTVQIAEAVRDKQEAQIAAERAKKAFVAQQIELSFTLTQLNQAGRGVDAMLEHMQTKPKRPKGFTEQELSLGRRSRGV